MTAHRVLNPLRVSVDNTAIGFAETLNFTSSEFSLSFSGQTASVSLTAPSSSSYVSVVPVWNEIPSGSVDGMNMTFTLTRAPIDNNVMLYLNGRLVREGSSNDYVLSGSALSMLTAPLEGDVLMSSYLTPGVARSWNEIPSGSVDGSNAEFYLSHIPNPGSLMLFLNGIVTRGDGNDYLITGNHITLSSDIVPISGDNLVSFYDYNSSHT